jgi:hypothetical protein
MGRPRKRSAAAPNLDAPETIRDFSVLTREQLARAAEQLQRELEAPQTIEARRLKYAALCRIERKLGSQRALRRVYVPPATRARPGSRIWREPQIQPSATPTPSRALDGFLSMLEGWKLDWTNAAEIERVGVPEYTPERALGVLLRAFAAGQIARAGVDIAPEAPSREQLVLAIREAA